MISSSRQRDRLRSVKAFSLPEVTISMGIVAVIILPTIALLASSGRLQQVAMDRSIAPLIVDSILTGFETQSEPGTLFIPLPLAPQAIRLAVPPLHQSTSVYLTADESGRLLGEVAESAYPLSILSPAEALYAVRVELATTLLSGTPDTEVIEI